MTPSTRPRPSRRLSQLLVALSMVLVVGSCRDGRSDPPAGKTPAPESPKAAPAPAPSTAAPAPTPSTAAPKAPTPALQPRVVLRAPDGREVLVRTEIASTPAERQRGLMFRKTMEPDAGMLFLMGVERPHQFWMKNTYLPLDMIWIGRDLRVVGVTENALPQTLDLRGIDAPSTYVLEVNAYFARQHGINPDWSAELIDVSQTAVP